MRLLLLLSLFGLGCTGTITPSITYGGSRNFSPEPAVEASTRKGLVRWVEATGITLEVTESGVPISVQDEWIYVNDRPVCGNTDFIENEIVVTTKKEKCSYFSFDSLVVHELGHAITGVGGHSVSGIMAEGGKAENRECIDEASLELVCRTADCEIFAPEC